MPLIMLGMKSLPTAIKYVPHCDGDQVPHDVRGAVLRGRRLQLPALQADAGQALRGEREGEVQVQGWDKRWAPGCVNGAGNARQKR